MDRRIFGHSKKAGFENYGTVPESLKQKIHEEKDMETLKRWHKLAAHTSSIEEFEKKMSTQYSPKHNSSQ